MIETERKYLLKSPVPQHLLGVGVPLWQGYLYTSPGEMRLRRYGDQLLLTVKGDGHLSRTEWEQAVPDWVFEQLWPRTEAARIQKLRYSLRYGRFTLEVDQFEGALEGLWLLECEFSDEQASLEFSLPEWAADAIEVTTNPAYKNKALAVKGRP